MICMKCNDTLMISSQIYWDLSVPVVACPKCRIINIVGSSAPWIQLPSPSLSIEQYARESKEIADELRGRAELARGIIVPYELVERTNAR